MLDQLPAFGPAAFQATPSDLLTTARNAPDESLHDVVEGFAYDLATILNLPVAKDAPAEEQLVKPRPIKPSAPVESPKFWTIRDLNDAGPKRKYTRVALVRPDGEIEQVFSGKNARHAARDEANRRNLNPAKEDA